MMSCIGDQGMHVYHRVAYERRIAAPPLPCQEWQTTLYPRNTADGNRRGSSVMAFVMGEEHPLGKTT
jgi:hypothetical protein